MAFEMTHEAIGLREIINKLSDEKLDSFKREAMAIMINEMELVVYEAKELLIAQIIPMPMGRSTGRLYMSITIFRIDVDNMEIEAGARTPYVAFMEFGTRKMHARPFWRMPVWNHFFRLRPQFYELIENYFG